jgi:hypothetical protein
MADPDPSNPSEATTPAADAADNVHELGRIVETGAQRLRRLQLEAHALAREQAQLFAGDLKSLAARAGEIAEGGDPFPVGVRELCSRLADELTSEAQTLLVIMDRSPKP